MSNLIENLYKAFVQDEQATEFPQFIANKLQEQLWQNRVMVDRLNAAGVPFGDGRSQGGDIHIFAITTVIPRSHVQIVVPDDRNAPAINVSLRNITLKGHENIQTGDSLVEFEPPCDKNFQKQQYILLKSKNDYGKG